MIIRYKFLTGENIEIEVSDRIGNVVMKIDKDIKNGNRRETRKQQSLNELIDILGDKSDILIDHSINIEEECIKKSSVEKLHNAIKKLRPQEQELIYKLYLNKHPITQSQYANLLGITENAVQKRATKIRNKLKKLL